MQLLLIVVLQVSCFVGFRTGETGNGMKWCSLVFSQDVVSSAVNAARYGLFLKKIKVDQREISSCC